MSPEPARGLNKALGSAIRLPGPGDFVQDRPTPRLVDKQPDGCHRSNNIGSWPRPPGAAPADLMEDWHAGEGWPPGPIDGIRGVCD